MEVIGLQVAVGVGEAAVRDVRPHLQQAPQGLGADAVAHVPLDLAVVAAEEETHLRVETLAHLRHAAPGLPGLRFVVAGEPPRVVFRVDPGRIGLRDEALDPAALADAPAAVDGVGPVVVIRIVPPDHEKPRGGALAEELPHAHDGEVVRGHLAEFSGAHAQQSDVGGAHLAGDTGSGIHRQANATGPDADPAAEEQLDLLRFPDTEQAGVLKEEGPLLGKEQAEPVQVDLLLVRLDLGEVRVVGEVQRQARGQRVLEVDPQFLFVAPAAAVDRPAEGVGRDGKAAVGGDGDAFDRAGERDPLQSELVRERGPERDLVVTADDALEVDAPALHVGVAVAQRRERNGHLGAPPGLGDLRPHVPDRVPVLVESGRGAEGPRSLEVDLGVVLDPGGVRAEHEAGLPVEEGVEHQPEAVGVVESSVPPGVGHDDRFRLAVVADDADVKRRVRVAQEHLGALGRGRAGRGLDLDEAGQRIDDLPSVVRLDDAVEDGGVLERIGAAGRRSLDAQAADDDEECEETDERCSGDQTWHYRP